MPRIPETTILCHCISDELDRVQGLVLTKLNNALKPAQCLSLLYSWVGIMLGQSVLTRDKSPLIDLMGCSGKHKEGKEK